MNATMRWTAVLGAWVLLSTPALAIAQTPGSGGTSGPMAPDARQEDRSARAAVSDAWITAKTKIALFADSRVAGWDVDVSTRNGVVDLNGKVESAGGRSTAEQIARGIDGVTDVRNNLQVVLATDRPRVEARDDDLERRVEAELGRDRELRSVDAEVNDGVVRLTGEVDSLAQSALASEMARRVPGVRAVTNEIMVKHEQRSGMDGARLSQRDERPGDLVLARTDSATDTQAPEAPRGSGAARPGAAGERQDRQPTTSDMTGAGGQASGAAQETVRDVQQALKEVGNDPGPIDGIMGPRTQEALREFQRAENLPVTGRLDPATMARLEIEGPVSPRR